jgi:hypothetical protein
VAHCISDLPAVASELKGAPPASGFALLIGARGEVYRLIFSSIHCSEWLALRLLHPDRAVPEHFQHFQHYSTTPTGQASTA